MPLSISSESKEFLLIPVTQNGGPPDEGNAVEVAIIPHVTGEDSEPEDGDFEDAVWDTGRARVMFGVAPFDLDAGYYEVWVRITATPEVPVKYSGRLRVT